MIDGIVLTILFFRRPGRSEGTLWSPIAPYTKSNKICEAHFDQDELAEWRQNPDFTLFPRYFPSYDIADWLDRRVTGTSCYPDGADPDLDGDAIVFDGNHVEEDLERKEDQFMAQLQKELSSDSEFSGLS